MDRDEFNELFSKIVVFLIGTYIIVLGGIQIHENVHLFQITSQGLTPDAVCYLGRLEGGAIGMVWSHGKLDFTDIETLPYTIEYVYVFIMYVSLTVATLWDN